MDNVNNKSIYIIELRKLLKKYFQEHKNELIENDINNLLDTYEDGEKSNKPYVCLQSLMEYNSFWTTNSQNEDPRLLTNGIIAYKILGFYNTPAECKKSLGYLQLEE